MVVKNISGQDLRIPEIRSIVPADGKAYHLPQDIAVLYKEYLQPIQLSDTPPPTQQQSRTVETLNQNAVQGLEELKAELGLSEESKSTNKDTLEPQIDKGYEWWQSLVGTDKIKAIFTLKPTVSVTWISDTFNMVC